MTSKMINMLEGSDGKTKTSSINCRLRTFSFINRSLQFFQKLNNLMAANDIRNRIFLFHFFPFRVDSAHQKECSESDKNSNRYFPCHLCSVEVSLASTPSFLCHLHGNSTIRSFKDFRCLSCKHFKFQFRFLFASVHRSFVFLSDSIQLAHCREIETFTCFL